jgi:cytochrome c peroxidase
MQVKSSKKITKFHLVIIFALLWVIVLSSVMVLRNLEPLSKEDSTLKTFTQIVNTPSSSQSITPLPEPVELNSDKVALGFKLFMDPMLSHDNTISCSSCHNLNHGGVDNVQFSFGIHGSLAKRNTPTVFNSGFNFKQFWDGRALTLEEQVEGPLLNPSEMGSSWDEILQKLRNSPEYYKLFNEIYREKNITDKQVTDAIATFERALVTTNSKFDNWLKGDKKALNEKQKQGFELFQSYGCISCHQGVNVGGNMFEKLGVFKDFYSNYPEGAKDLGRFDITHNDNAKNEFKVPSLRNVALTAPYLHNGSIKTLHAMIDIMATYQLGIKLPESEIQAIEAFLNSLTGETPAVLIK